MAIRVKSLFIRVKNHQGVRQQLDLKWEYLGMVILDRDYKVADKLKNWKMSDILVKRALRIRIWVHRSNVWERSCHM